MGECPLYLSNGGIRVDKLLLSFLATENALFVVLTFTVHLGHFLGLKKCMIVPATIIVYLGMLVESVA